jgi:hypothetical protein
MEKCRRVENKFYGKYFFFSAVNYGLLFFIDKTTKGYENKGKKYIYFLRLEAYFCCF